MKEHFHSKLYATEKYDPSLRKQYSVKRLLKFTAKMVSFETIIWVFSLLYLIFIHTPGDVSFTLCPLKNLGFEFCPGCGLGNSISYIFHGEFSQSFVSHPLGLFAFLVLCFRIMVITKNNWSNYGKHITINALS